MKFKKEQQYQEKNGPQYPRQAIIREALRASFAVGKDVDKTDLCSICANFPLPEAKLTIGPRRFGATRFFRFRGILLTRTNTNRHLPLIPPVRTWARIRNTKIFLRIWPTKKSRVGRQSTRSSSWTLFASSHLSTTVAAKAES